MSDIPEIVELARTKLSVTFSRAVSDGNYGTIKAEAWVQGDVAADSTPAAITDQATLLLQTAAVAVWDQLGIKYHPDEITGLLVEESVPEVKVSAPKQLGQASTPSSGGGSVRVMNPNEQQGDLPDWLVAECGKLGITAVWDQRKTATGRQPHFKEAVPRGGTGHGKDGEPKAFWPPR
ncbi:MAG: hypothetical protein ACK53T_00180 [Planctomycetota bacterium]|jgi:hypothetical protein